MLPAASSSLRDASFSSLRASLASFSRSDWSSPTLPSIVNLRSASCCALTRWSVPDCLLQALDAFGRRPSVPRRAAGPACSAFWMSRSRPAVHFLRELLLRVLQLVERRLGRRRRCPACRWRPPAASHWPRPAAAAPRRRDPAAAARATAVRAGAPLLRLPARAAAGRRRRRRPAVAVIRPALRRAGARLPAAGAARAPSASRRAVDRPVARLLLGLLLHLVLVGQLVELELEQVREVFGHLALTAAAATAALLLRRSASRTAARRPAESCSARCSGSSASSGFIAFRSASACSISAAAFGSCSAIDRNSESCSSAPSRSFSFSTSSSTCDRELGLREIQEHDVLAVLVRLGLRLVANRVERRRDDLALLARQLADVAAAATAAAAGLRLRLRLAVVLLERPDLHEVDVARRRLGAVVVGRLREVGHEVARLQPQLFEIDRVARADLGQRLRRRRTARSSSADRRSPSRPSAAA